MGKNSELATHSMTTSEELQPTKRNWGMAEDTLLYHNAR